MGSVLSWWCSPEGCRSSAGFQSCMLWGLVSQARAQRLVPEVGQTPLTLGEKLGLEPLGAAAGGACEAFKARWRPRLASLPPCGLSALRRRCRSRSDSYQDLLRGSCSTGRDPGCVRDGGWVQDPPGEVLEAGSPPSGGSVVGEGPARFEPAPAVLYAQAVRGPTLHTRPPAVRPRWGAERPPSTPGPHVLPGLCPSLQRGAEKAVWARPGALGRPPKGLSVWQLISSSKILWLKLYSQFLTIDTCLLLPEQFTSC